MIQPIQLELAPGQLDTWQIATGINKGTVIGRIVARGNSYDVVPDPEVNRSIPGNVVSYQHTEFTACLYQLMAVAYHAMAHKFYG